MAKERTCMMCGCTYKYCGHCREYQNYPGWKYLYHDEKCKAIGDLWYAYRGNEISKEDAKKQLSALKPNIDAVLKYTGTIASNEIREIFDITTEEVVPKKSDNPEDKSITEKQQTKKRTSKKESYETE